jgi:hypothetical protein
MPSGRVELARTTCYDNIASGSAVTTKERTILGDAPPVKIVGGGEGTAGANAKGHSNIAVGQNYPTTVIPDDIAIGVVTGPGDNVKVGG